jgi:superfamily II DNA helicase RecQ
MAVTATATDGVAADILKTLGMSKARTFKVILIYFVISLSITVPQCQV